MLEVKAIEPLYQVTLPPTPASVPYCSDKRIILDKLGVINALFKLDPVEAPSNVR